MEENASFIRTTLASSGSPAANGHAGIDAEAVAQTYEGLAKTYQRIADSVRERTKASGTGPEGSHGTVKSGVREVDVLESWAARGKELLG